MKQIAGIVAEYNPFHKGHAYQIAETRNKGATHIVAVMSGHLVQRGDIPVMDKWARAKAALLGGVDLVIELPAPFALASAERFALGAVTLLDALGCVDELSFGCECGELGSLETLLQILDANETQRAVADFLAAGCSYPSAMAQAAGLAFPQAKDFLSGANNTLALEYCRALKKRNSSIRPVAILRRGAEHDSMEEHAFPSASYIRCGIRSGKTGEGLADSTAQILLEEQAAGRCPMDMKALETALMVKLRQSAPEDLLHYEEIGEGLQNRILQCAGECATLSELCGKIKVKRYTMARIRRILTRILFDLTKEDTPSSPPYLRILGFNDKGKEILRFARTTASLPLIHKAADVRNLPEEACALFAMECRVTDTLGLCCPHPQNSGREMTAQTIRIMEEPNEHIKGTV